MKTYSLQPDGSLLVNDNGLRSWSIGAINIAAHRRDPEFEKGLQAAAGQPNCLTAAQLAKLPVPA